MPPAIQRGIMTIRGEKPVDGGSLWSSPFSSASLRRISSKGIIVFSASKTKRTLTAMAEREMTRQLNPMTPKLLMTFSLVPMLRPITSMRTMRARSVAASNSLKMRGERPPQFMAAPAARHIKGTYAFIISPLV